MHFLLLCSDPDRYLIDIIMTHKSFLLAVLIVGALAAVEKDLMDRVPVDQT